MSTPQSPEQDAEPASNAEIPDHLDPLEIVEKHLSSLRAAKLAGVPIDDALLAEIEQRLAWLKAQG